MTQILITEERKGPQYYVLWCEGDLNRAALKILRRRAESGEFYPEPDSLRLKLNTELQTIDACKKAFIAGDPSIEGLDRTFAGRSKRLQWFKQFREDKQAEFDLQIAFADQLKTVLDCSDDEILEMKWTFDDGSTADLAYTLIALRRHLPGEGYSIITPEYT